MRTKSKSFMKNLCEKNNIPTARFSTFNNFDDAYNFIKKKGVPIVIKADGLAAGKGVSVCTSINEAIKEAINEANKEGINRAVNQAVYQAVKEAINEAINEAVSEDANSDKMKSE